MDRKLFGVVAPTLRAAIKAIYKSGTLCPVSTQRCDLATPKGWATYYNLEVVIALAFRLNTYEASRIRQNTLLRVAPLQMLRKARHPDRSGEVKDFLRISQRSISKKGRKRLENETKKRAEKKQTKSRDQLDYYSRS